MNNGPIAATILCCLLPLGIFAAGWWAGLHHQRHGLGGFLPDFGKLHRAARRTREQSERAQSLVARRAPAREVDYDA